jgi:nucleoside 2-deoxyribosyltransferase
MTVVRQTPTAVYLASDFARYPYVDEVARRLEALTHDVVVVSSWHASPSDEEVAAAGTTTAHLPPSAQDIALRADEAIRRCDTFVVFTTGEYARGGRHFETGLAYGLRKRIIVVGPEEHAFHSLPNVDVVTPGVSPEETASLLASMVQSS